MRTQEQANSSVRSRTTFWIFLSVGLSVALHALGILLDARFGGSFWANEPVHSFVETSGAIVGLTVAGLLLLMHRMKRGTQFAIPLAFGLIAMAVLDGLHAVVAVGQSFVWLHSVATFAGGVLFALTLLPTRHGPLPVRRRFPVELCFVVALLMILAGAATFVAPDALPRMVVDGRFTSTAVMLNIGGGALMILAAARLAVAYRNSRHPDDLLFSVHCVLFGGAAVMFEQSQLWDFSWWWWHGLRLAAYSVALVFAAYSLIELQRDVLRHNDELESAYSHAVGTAQKNSGELVALRAALDKHTLFSITDAKGRIVDVNEGFCSISGFSRDELIGSDHRILNSGHHPKAFWVDMWKTIASGKHWRAEVCNRAKDGSLYWVDSTNIPQFDADGNIERFISLRFDITNQKAVQERLDLATRAASVGLWDWDLQTNDTYFSDTFYTMLGYEPGDFPMTLKSWVELVHPDDLDDALAAVNRHHANEERVYENELRLRTKSGGWVWIRTVGETVEHTADGAPRRMLGVHIDVQQMKDALDAANLSSQAKSDFLANMSHEIRTPMTAILGYVDLLADPTLGEDGFADNINTIKRNGEHLLAIINDVLDVSKIEAGQMTIEKIETNPAQIIEEVASLTRPRAKGKGVDVRVRYDTPIPKTIQTDPTRLRQILLNLVGNAIKFTEIGSVTLHAACDVSRERVTIRVVDTGIGMTQEQADAISRFEAFNQADASTTRVYGGTGLGLRISNALATMLGGGIEIESERGAGSTFSVSITTGGLEEIDLIDPEQIPSYAEVERVGAESAGPVVDSSKPLAGCHVLLAEDGPDNQRLVSFHLKKAGAEVTICENGLIAAETIEGASPERCPHVVLMDMQMPELDGYSATRRLREGGCDLPIIALTAHAMDGDREKCINAGCDNYLTKPIDKVRLVETCADYFLKGRSGSRAA